MKKIIIFITLSITLSCATIDLEKNISDVNSGKVSSKSEKTKASMPTVIPIEVPPEIIIIDKPVYIPEVAAPKASPSGRPAVEESNRQGIVKPSEYSRATMIYDYNSDWVYEVYTQPLRASDLRLEPGEKIAEAPFISDSERWIIGAGVSFENGSPVQHIYVKPTETRLEASLIINTDRRVYHVILRSFTDIHMPMVRWRYPNTAPRNFIQNYEKPSTNDSSNTPSVSTNSLQVNISPESLSFNYKITHGFGKPSWIPELVYDDGKKTYIAFPDKVLPNVMPTVFEERNNVLNYRVAGKVIIIDKLIERITVKIERKEILIQKKRG